MSVYIDADAFVRWEKGEFDLPEWLRDRGDEPALFPATAWQQLNYGVFDWAETRAEKRALFLSLIGSVVSVAPFSKRHAEKAAELAANMKREQIGFADFQIAATAIEDNAELLTFNREHFARVPGLKLADL
jgi:tRNA(fMet)-specific endonuclease VapC